MADAAAIFRRPFAEQVAAFRLRLSDLRPTRTWLDLWQAEHDRAFMVAGALKADLLADLAEAVRKAIEDGTGLEAFRAEFRDLVERHGWHGWTGEETKRGRAWRTKVIYKTNMATTYAAGRWAQLKKAGYPLLVYRHGGSLDPRPEHLSWDGLILPADHPFWATHAPPNGWGCSCFVTGARSERDAVRKGGKPGKVLPQGWAVLNPETGAPQGIDRGWAYAPGASVAETVSQIAGKIGTLPPPIAAGVKDAFPEVAVAVPATQRPLGWRDWPEIKTLSELAAAAQAAGVATTVNLRPRLPLAGLNDYLRISAEIRQRFDLPVLNHFALGEDLPFPVRGAKKAAAFYVPARLSMGVQRKGITNKWVVANFDREDHPSAVAVWYDQLSSVASEVQVIARQMQPRRWSVVRDVPSVAAHEWGHHLHYSWRQEVDALIRQHDMIAGGWPKLISRYADTNIEEFMAESFALYVTQPNEHFRLHPALLAYFKRKDRS